MERISNAMGDYAGTFPVNLLTNKMRGAGEANSTLIGFKNKRFMYCSEPEAGAKLNTNFVKMLTGDTIKARGLYSNDEEDIKPTYNIFVCCNELPGFDTHDEGIARRIRIIDYKTKFCENPKKKNELSIKRYTKEELHNIERGLLHIFITRYKQLLIKDFKYTEPEVFQNIKNLYINDSKDDLSNILRENLEAGSKTDFVKLKDIKQILKSNGFNKSLVSVKYIIQDLFEECEYYDTKMINYKNYKSIFYKIKIR
jgi:phage/plasmid-associated DNA primase